MAYHLALLPASKALIMNTLKQLLVLGIIALSWISCDMVEPPVYGCIDPLASNYDPATTLSDGPCQGDCEYGPDAILGCMDATALNYNAAATSDDCSCIFEGSRNVLMEDYTGHRCNNCPQAAEIIHDLQGTYGARVVAIAIHASEFFAGPINLPEGPYSTDFRTTEGNDWDNEFGISGFGLPGGMINRQNDGGVFALGREQWDQKIMEALEPEPEALINISHSYDSVTRLIDATIEISALADLANAPYMLTVVLTEDSIVDWQQDNRLADPNIPNYVHNHVLRANFNGTWGNNIGGGNTLTAGQALSSNQSLTIDTEFVDKNCNIVAFVYRDDTKEVIQAQYVHLIE
jgi:hypothetical protein